MTRADILQVLYPVPNPFDTLEQYHRATHQDVAGMDPQDARREIAQVRARLLVSTPEDGTAWLEERIVALSRRLRG